MADDKKDPKKEAEGAKEAAPAAAAGKKKLFMIIGGVVALILVVGTPVVFFTMKSSQEGSESLDSGAAQEEGEDIGTLEGSTDEDELQEGEEALGAIYPLESFVVNLQGGRYIRCQIQLEFVERDVPQRFYARLIPVRDSLIKLLAMRSADDATSEKGRDTLKNDIKETVNEILKREEVKNVYFTQFVVQ